MKPIYLAPLLGLTACATTVGGIMKEDVVATYSSAKAPLEVAKCMQAQARGLDIEFPDPNISVSSRNPYGSILINWLIRPTPTGSTIEVRKTSGITPGIAQAETCF